MMNFENFWKMMMQWENHFKGIEEPEQEYYFEVYQPVTYFKIGGKTKEEARQNLKVALKDYYEIDDDEIVEKFLIRHLKEEFIPNGTEIISCIRKD